MPLNCHPAAIRALAVFAPIPFLGPPEGRVSRRFAPIPFLGPPEGRVSGLLLRYHSLDRRKVEFPGLFTMAGWRRHRD